MQRTTFSARLLHPKYWLTWLGFGVWYLLSLLPIKIQFALGKVLGRLMGKVAKKRVAIARRNLELCFPKMSKDECDQHVRGILDSMGIAFFEFGIAWFWSRKRLDSLYTVEGLEYLEQAQSDGVGVILLAFHFSNIDLGGKLIGRKFSVDGSYRPHNNPVYDLLQKAGRERYTQKATAIPRDDVRAMVRVLRNGRMLWYAPDQDYGPKHSIFVPFFGVPAATITATAQLARLGKARVIPYTQTRLENGRYHIAVSPPLDNFPSGDEVADATLVNQECERQVLANMDQYLWVHRRFKTRPDGEPSLYGQLK